MKSPGRHGSHSLDSAETSKRDIESGNEGEVKRKSGRDIDKSALCLQFSPAQFHSL